MDEMKHFEQALNEISGFLQNISGELGPSVFVELFGGTTISRVKDPCGWTNATACRPFNKQSIEIGDKTFINLDGTPRDEMDIIGTVAHELAHIWDNNNNERLSRGLKLATGGSTKCKYIIFGCRYVAIDSPASENLQAQGNRVSWNQKEDFAITFDSLIVDPQSVNQDRIDYFTDLIINEIDLP